MSVPYNQTVSELCRAALRRAGQPAPSAGQIQDAVSNQFQEVKNDIRRKADTHPLLETKEVTVLIIGRQEYALPTTANIVKSVVLHTGPSAWLQQLATGGVASWTVLSSDFSESSDALLGKPVFVVSQTGSLQYSYINSYTNSTRTIVVSPSVTTATDSTSYIRITDARKELYTSSRQILNYDRHTFAAGVGEPTRAAIEGETLYLDKGPDITLLPLLWTFYADIELLDEDGSLFTKILREWRSLFMAGVTSKSMILYDDTRANDMTMYYEGLLDKLGQKSLEIGQTAPYDPTYS